MNLLLFAMKKFHMATVEHAYKNKTVHFQSGSEKDRDS